MMRTLAHVVSCFTDAYVYDALGQVVSARFGEGADPDLYDYDPIGNFVSNRLRGAWTQFDANELNEYATLSTPSTPSTLSTLSTPSTTALAYDPDGNLLTNGVWSYAYDSMNRLSAAVSNGVAVAEYAYDAFWRRVGRRAGGAEHRTLYDDWNPVRESVSTDAGTTVRDFHWGKDLSGTFQGAGGVGGLLAVRRADGLFLPSYDNLGNVVAYADAAGSVVAAYAYDAFGRTASASGPLATTFAHGFSTKPLDRETGLHYYGYRFYDSGMGRWMNREPRLLPDANNLSFTDNRPFVLYDVLGLQPQSNAPEAMSQTNEISEVENPSQSTEDNQEEIESNVCHIYVLIGHFGKKENVAENSILAEARRLKTELTQCDSIYSISCHMVSFLSQLSKEGLVFTFPEKWPPDWYQTDRKITTFDYPVLLPKARETNKMLAQALKEKKSCCCEKIRVHYYCDKDANEGMELLLKNKDDPRTNLKIDANPCGTTYDIIP